MRLPEGWSVVTLWNPETPEARGRWGRFDPALRCVWLYPRWWAALAWPLIRFFVLRHEIGHAWGIPAGGCLGWHKWCVMAEEGFVGYPDGSWLGKLALLWHQARGLGGFCPNCRDYLINRGAFNG